VQGSVYSTAVKSLITVSTIVLLGLVIAYHGLQAQVGTGAALLLLLTSVETASVAEWSACWTQAQ